MPFCFGSIRQLKQCVIVHPILDIGMSLLCPPLSVTLMLPPFNSAFTFIPVYPLSSTLTHFHPLPYSFINFIHFHPLSFTFIQFHPTSSTLIHYHPIASHLGHFHPLSSTFIHYHPLKDAKRYELMSNVCVNFSPSLRTGRICGLYAGLFYN